MTVYNYTLPIYRDLIARLFPKLENRNYCLLLQNAQTECKDSNYKDHPPCQQILEFIKKLDCYSLEERPLYEIKSSEAIKKALNK